MKEILLINGQGAHLTVEEKSDESLWNNGTKLFDSIMHSTEVGWKVDAVKVIVFPLFPPGERN